MKERFVRIGIEFNEKEIIHYVKEIKKHWWSKWEIVMNGLAPMIFYKLPKGARAINEIPSFPHKGNYGAPPPFIRKGTIEIRKDMINMVRNADEIYVGIIQDGKYYLACDTKNIQNCRDLQSLEIADEEIIGEI